MSAITKELRAAAKCAPMWKAIFEAAADEIERLQKRDAHFVNVVGSVNEIKADAARGMIEYIDINGDWYNLNSEFMECYANKLERGEL